MRGLPDRRRCDLRAGGSAVSSRIDFYATNSVAFGVIINSYIQALVKLADSFKEQGNA